MATEKTPAADPVIEMMRQKHPSTPDQLIPMLQYVQGELGYLAPEALIAIADYLKAPASHVYGVATFYAQFRFKPLGKNRITVCRGTACHVRGSARLIEEIERELKIKAGETTDDLAFSLETVACIGSCALAPVMIVNDKVYGKATTKRAKQLLDELRGIAPATEKKEEKPVEKKPVKPEPKARVVEPKAKVEKAPAKPAGKRAAGRKVKTAVKKPVKKAVKKAAKKAAKKPVKKTAKKAIRKAGPKNKAARKTGKTKKKR